ncbi:OB-fold nucleic acid binding domain, AA-tRNA synthetase-type and Nucleic acid-binding, OB-fold domain-containing protein [Strongyloides ratti]|uniref:OB-fold nucleic acid binding domain, AA-tRNA synthetase-type and Nucleic acid-binding, OB-fold domain-containing protein n=1 Tax=Strongyloides ratti TaxID=34506 RepID=A0A090MWV8_STRRB|nr:OB-fold nucleic acid binding domain, AA-tRNA synthetase-type and Nucleic acid-binding, OB-fold domain-containing protein [Strongyloides ratti]CEF64359.1 OB-fold nucleic acid binding domain, AA-tRNA synthetase-type and Nucleic acid-binding, OB-fold domain-containing protein [Strongyloides ratti]
MNATFGGDDWNTTMDTSTLGDTQDTRIKNFDPSQQPLSVEIKDLCAIPDGRDKITYGTYNFSKISFCGKVINVENEDGSLIYVVADMDDSSQTIKCYSYNTNNSYNQKYVEGSIIGLCGKLHYRNSQLDVITLSVYEISDLTEIDVFKLWARLAKFEFERGFLNMMYSGLFEFDNVKGYGLPIRGDKKKMAVGAAASVSGESVQALGQLIIRHLKESGRDKFNVVDMALALNVSAERVYRAVEALEAEGNVFMDGEGSYGLGC